MASRQFNTKAEMEESFARGRGLVQYELAHPDDIQWANELVAEGRATLVSDWIAKDFGHQKRRTLQGIARAGVKPRPPEGQYA